MPRTAANRFVRAFLQQAQQLRLHREMQLANLVQKQRTTVSQLGGTRALRVRAGECAAFVTKQLAHGKLGGQRSAIHYDQFALVGPLVERMNQPRQQVFASAGFSQQQH